MKNFRKPYLSMVMAAIFLFVSCEQYNGEVFEEKVEVLNYQKALDNFKKKYEVVKPKICKYKDLPNKSKKDSNEIELLLKTLAKPSLELLMADGFNKSELIEMLGKNYINNKVKTAVVGLMFYELKINLKDTHMGKTNHQNPIIECFNEATGIAAGVALIAALSGQAGGKALRKAFMKAVKKIGGKLVSGIGLVLMAAEFIYCLASGDES